MDMHNTLNALLDIARLESWVKQFSLLCEEMNRLLWTSSKAPPLFIITMLATMVNAQYFYDE